MKWEDISESEALLITNVSHLQVTVITCYLGGQWISQIKLHNGHNGTPMLLDTPVTINQIASTLEGSPLTRRKLPR